MLNDPEAEKQLQSELSDGEKLLWAGRPQTGVKFVLRDILFIPFGIVWFVGALLWESIAMLAKFPFNILLGLVGIPFVLLGIYITFGRFIYDKRRRKNTFYGITAKRVIIKLIKHKPIVEVFDITALSAMEINEKSDGSGVIKLEADQAYYSAWKTGYVYRKIVWAIEYVQDVRSIYDLILHQQLHNNKHNL